MTCPRCGRSNPDDAAHCAGCGAPLGGASPTLTGIRPPVAPGVSLAPDRTLTSSGLRRGAAAGGPTLAPGTLLGTRYEILAVLGEGGMGTVYKAQDRDLGRLVALKVIRPDMAERPEILERFKREILLASQVTHKNVLRIHDLGEAGDVRFISMNYVEGTNLKEMLVRDGALPLDRGLPLARQIGEALQAAHDAGVVHRDLKPQNILLDRDGNAYIADFGISRSLAEGGTMTDTGTILGTVDYMSPEQARGETPDHRGDIYLFGVILYEMFTGALPFRAQNALSVMMKRLHEDAPTIRASRPETPAWLSAVVARAMQRDPKDRYQNAIDLLKDIDRRRASRSWRRFARPRYWAAAAAVLVAALLIARPQTLQWRPWGEAAAPPPRTSLALLPFQNATGDPRYDWVRQGLPSLMRTELIQAKALRLVGEDRVQGILASLKIDDGSDTTPETARRIASLLGAENVLAGRLVRIADRLRLDATLETPGGSSAGGVAAASDGSSIVIDGEGDKAIFTMVDSLADKVRDRLGVAGGLLEKRRGATELTTGSVEALALYGEGLALARGGNQIEAAKRFEGAVEKDPRFAAARASLAETYDRLGYADKAAAEAGRAAEGLGSASPFEAARIKAVRARLSGDSTAAIAAYRELTALAPNSADTHYDLAAALQDSGDLPGALKSLDRVITLDPKYPSAHYALGRVQYRLGKGAEALKELNTALALYSEAGNDEGKAAVLNGLGNTYRDLISQPAEALKNYQAALEIRKRIGDRRGEAVTLRNLGKVQRDLGRQDEGIANIRQAIAIENEISNREGLAESWSDIGDLQQSAGRPEQALSAYQESLRIARDLDDPLNLARTLASVGYIDSVLGRYVEAFIFLKEALAKRREVGEPVEIVRSLVDIGMIEQLQGRYEEAVRYATEGLPLARQAGAKFEVLVLLANLANIDEDQGRYGPALAQLAEARHLADEVDDKTLIATCLIYSGSVRRHLGDLAGSATLLDDAIARARGMDNAPLLAEALIHRSALERAAGRRARAAAAATEAVARAKATGDVRLILMARLQSGAAAGKVAEIQDIAKQATTTGLAPLAAAARLEEARAHLDARRDGEALRAAEEAARLAAPMRMRDLRFQSLAIAIRVLRGGGKSPTASERAAQAMADLDEMRQGLEAADRRRLLERESTVQFAKDAGALFQGADHAADAARLQGLMTP